MISRAPRANPRSSSSTTTRPISRATKRARRARRCTIRRRAWRWCRDSACSAWARASATPSSPPTSPDRDRRHHRCRSHRPLHLDLRSRHIRLRILAAGARQARRRAKICRCRGKWLSSPAPAALSGPPPPKPLHRPARKWRCSISIKAAAQGKATAIDGHALALACDVTNSKSVAAAFEPSGGGVRRRRYCRVECRRRLAGQDRRGRRSDPAPELSS